MFLVRKTINENVERNVPNRDNSWESLQKQSDWRTCEMQNGRERHLKQFPNFFGRHKFVKKCEEAVLVRVRIYPLFSAICFLESTIWLNNYRPRLSFL